MLVTDTMHSLFDGLAQYHFHEVLKLMKMEGEAAEEVSAAFIFEFSIPTDNDIIVQRLEASDIKEIIKIHQFLVAMVEGANNAEVSTNLQKLTKHLEGKHLKPLQFVLKSLQLQLIQLESTLQNASMLKHW